MTPSKPIRYDVGFINPFLEAVVSVLTTMANVAATPGKPYVNTNRTATGDVTGLIGITGNNSAGTMSLTLTKGAIPVSYTHLRRRRCSAVCVPART